MKHIDSKIAFDNAIANGTLSGLKDAVNFAALYMYMHTDDNNDDHFKNINTRCYVVSPSPFKESK